MNHGSKFVDNFPHIPLYFEHQPRIANLKNHQHNAYILPTELNRSHSSQRSKHNSEHQMSITMPPAAMPKMEFLLALTLRNLKPSRTTSAKMVV